MFVAIAQALSLDRCSEGFCDGVMTGYGEKGCFDCINGFVAFPLVNPNIFAGDQVYPLASSSPPNASLALE
jgi:hypothetical protein